MVDVISFCIAISVSPHWEEVALHLELIAPFSFAISTRTLAIASRALRLQDLFTLLPPPCL